MLTWRRDKHTHSPLPLPPVSEPLIKSGRSSRLIYWGSVKSALGKMATQTVVEILEKRKKMKEKVLHFDKSKSTTGVQLSCL